MNPIVKITSLFGLIALAQACGTDKGLAGPGGSKPLAADATAEDQPAYGPWGPPVNVGPVVNSPYNDNHPAISRDGLSLYITSGRPGGVNGINLSQFEEIWVSQRPSPDADWGPPVNLGPAINSIGSNTGSPTFTPDGHQMYFHSSRPEGCGLADLYEARRHDKRDDFGWEPAENLGCVVNSSYADNGPMYFEDEATGITTLYFTRRNNPPTSDQGYDIYASTRIGDEGAFGPPVLIPELSSPYRDTRTAIRRDGLEIFVSSGRPGDDVVGHSAGSEDLWVSTRAKTSDVWSPPVNVSLVNQQLGGPPINGPYFDGAPALSFDGTTLYFFSDRPGGFGKRDLYVTTRMRLSGPDARDDADVAGHPARREE